MRRHLVPVAAYALLTTVGLYGTAAALPESRLAASLPGTGTVDSADIIDGQVKGVDVAESSLGTVPNAAKVGGLQVKKFRKSVTGYTQSNVLLFQMGTMKVWFQCGEGPLGGGYLPYVLIGTTVNDATVVRTSVGNLSSPDQPATVYRTQDLDVDTAELVYTSPASYTIDVGYRSPAGTVASLHIEGDNNQVGGEPTGCEAWGTAIGG